MCDCFRINDLEPLYDLPENSFYIDGVLPVLIACAKDPKVWDVTFYIGGYIMDFYGKKQMIDEIDRRCGMYNTREINAYYDMSLNVDFETQ